MPPWFRRVPELWQVVVIVFTVMGTLWGGSYTLARWFGWQEWGPRQRLEALQRNDSIQVHRDSTQDYVTGLLDVRLAHLSDSLWGAVDDIRRDNRTNLALLCALVADRDLRLAQVRARCP